MDKELEQRYKKARKYADVAIELVKEGLYLEQFMTGKRASVRAAVVEYHPHLRKMMLTENITAAVWRKYYNLLYTEPHPDKELLTRFLQIEKPKAVADVDDYELDKLQLKLKAMNEKVPTMARTMTCGQLYQAGYDAWANGLSGKDLEIVSLMQYHLDTYENEVAYLLDAAVYKYRLSHSETMTFVRKYRDLRLEGHNINEALELAQN
jgi:hypothetical protein